ncbi:MAG: RNA-processing protein [Methanocorpusculum sp.]|jgi:nucleolar protein 56|nr:RNA-processing protein [Methanocorpusculum sp.]MEE1135898.1 RNA-processing protein [Methanocorpusculum sp.]HJJ68888.1 RNA-processing protein [Methanocorpusculum sp.]HJJ70218.1 RNA-processing protein [Methanocorpusculum sp.]HJJ73838.1 RNA-processing protein [Methanocorpusculum sp.]
MNWYGESGSYSIDVSEASERVRKNTDNAPKKLCDWTELKDAGLVSSRAEYIASVRAVASSMAEEGIAASLSEKDTDLLQMVRMLDELDEVINLLTERLTEWYQSTTPDSSRKYNKAASKKFIQTVAKSKNPSMKQVAREILSLTNLRTQLMKDVSRKADEVIPNMSALVGGLVAARLVSRAGGLTLISRMAASSIQVLGAESALFSHIRAGTPSPKHGLIFQHRRVHNAPRDVRGKLARILASKLAIAARLDAFRGELDEAFLADANEKIDKIMEVSK